MNLTPFVPLSFQGEGEETLERGEAPLLPTRPLPLLREGGQGDRFPNNLISLPKGRLLVFQPGSKGNWKWRDYG